MQKLERYLDGPLPRAGLLVLGLMLFGFGIALSFEGLPAGAIATYGAGVISILFFYLSRFKKIEAFGVKAEAWDQKMQEAAELIDRLQGLSAAVAGPLFTIVARMGRWDASSRKSPARGGPAPYSSPLDSGAAGAYGQGEGNRIQLDITPLIPHQMRDILRKLLVIWISGLAVFAGRLD